jgi:5-methylcytosine-specific restriction endonuclease McrA
LGRPKGPLTRCDGKWTEAQFHSFVKNNLRSASRKWAPIQACKKKAHKGRGEYECAECLEIVPPTYYDEEKRKRMRNIFIDHRVPIIDPATGFTTWDECINRMYCDSENLQLLCKSCHKVKSLEEIEIAKKRRAASKEELLEELEEFDIEED